MTELNKETAALAELEKTKESTTAEMKATDTKIREIGVKYKEKVRRGVCTVMGCTDLLPAPTFELLTTLYQDISKAALFFFTNGSRNVINLRITCITNCILLVEIIYTGLCNHR